MLKIREKISLLPLLRACTLDNLYYMFGLVIFEIHKNILKAK